MAKKRFEKNKTDMRSLERNKGGAKVNRRKKRRRSSYGRIALVVTVLAVAAVGVALSLTVFFKIKNVDVSGDQTIYTSKQIISAGKIEFDTNLIRLDSDAVKKRIETQLPYVQQVKVIKRLPTTVELSVSPATEAGYIECSQGYAVISTKGKILQILKDDPKTSDRKLAKISGITVENAQVGSFVSNDNDTLKSVEEIYNGLGAALARDVTEINVAERINMSFTYRDRIDVRLGSESELAEKLKFVALLIADNQKIADDDMGIIYASNPKRVSFLRKGSYSEYIAEQERLEVEKNPASPEQEEDQNTQNVDDTSSENTSSNVSSLS